ncbi:hypothetical protein KY334_06770 [Candidatus Woesearchaeota archaeon]|nr:hypothetical protein [Candidatus Woesearchaeota archaeon]
MYEFNLKRTLIWIVSSIISICLLYYGFIADIEGFRNIVYVLVWIEFLLILLAIYGIFIRNSELLVEAIKNTKRNVPFIIYITFRVSVSIFFIWNGTFVIAGIYIFSTIATEFLTKICLDIE